MKITFQNIDDEEIDESMQDRLKLKLHKMGAKFNWIKEGTVYFKVEKNDDNKDKVVELLLKIPGHDIYAQAQEETFIDAIKESLEGVRKQLEMHK